MSFPEPALGLRFKVVIDGYGDLGNWHKCDGLSIEYDIHEYREGGQNGFVHRLPGRAKYQNIRLTRPVDPTSATVTTWVSGVQRAGGRQTAQISVLDGTGAPVATWSLIGVYPARWTGPTLDIGTNQIATETLELAHNGFMGAS